MIVCRVIWVDGDHVWIRVRIRERVRSRIRSWLAVHVLAGRNRRRLGKIKVSSVR